MAEYDLIKRHTDYISSNHEVFCWAFRLDVLEKTDGMPVTTALFQGLKDLSESKNKRLRDRRFTIWMGDDARMFYWVAMSHPAVAVTNLLCRHFSRVAGYETSESALLTQLPVMPRFRYERGQVIEYSDRDLVGTWRVDDGDWYGSGLTVLRRYAASASLASGERYGG